MNHPTEMPARNQFYIPDNRRIMSRLIHFRSISARQGVARIACLAALALSLLGGGCTRKYWREQADDLSYDIIRKKEIDPRWSVPRIDVAADPRSRFYDPFDPDFTPLPPDDPAAHEYMHWLYGMNGYSKWHEFGDLPAVENPDWLEPFGMSQEVIAANYGNPAVLPQIEKLTLEEAVELAWVHNRDYQTQIENVYLVALALTFQRFQFDLQYIGFSGRPSSEVSLEDVPGVEDSVNWGNSVGVSQLFPSGAQFVAELANNTLWLFSAGKSDSTASVFSYSLVQPLLANAGRRFNLEGLTFAERVMLYSLRDLARFRMGFFTSTVSGGGTAGLFSGVQNVAQPLAALTTPIVGGGNNAGGYLGLLQQIQNIYNQEYNITQLKEQLDRIHSTANQRPEWLGEDLFQLPPELGEAPALPAPANPVAPGNQPADAQPDGRAPEAVPRRQFKEGALPAEFAGKIRYNPDTQRLYLRGTISDAELKILLGLSPDRDWALAVSQLANRSIEESETINQNIAQLQTQLANNCNQLRSSRVNLQNSIDQYKLFLGLPPDMPITIDDSVLRPFQFIDPRLLRLQDRLKAFVPEPPEISDSHPDVEAMRRVQSLLERLAPNAPDLLVTMRGLVDEMEVLRADIQHDGLDVLEDDFRRFADHLANGPPKPPNDGCLQVYRDPEANQRLRTALLAAFNETVANLDNLKQKLQADDVDIERRLQDLSEVREDFLKLTRSLSVVQINLRVDLIDLNQFSLERDESVAVGLQNRMDLMNARAQVMDARRNVEVAANQLQAVLNVVAAGDIRTDSLLSGNGNPLDFRGDQSSIRAGVQFTTPVQLVQQRNVYRGALIAYQRARRNYMRIEDQVKLDLRITWRNLNVQRQNFETAREQVRAAAAQLDIQSELSTAPVVGTPGSAGAGGQAQGLNTLNALNSVLNAQNQMIQIWVNYEAFRLNIYNFMGTMEIDEFGFWVDDFYQRRATAARAGRTLNDLPPQPTPAEQAPSSPPQELKDEPTDATEVAPQPQPTAARPSSPKRDANVQPVEHLQPVRGETWPERPAAAAARRRGEKAPAAVARPADRAGRRRLVLEHQPSLQPRGTDRSDH